MSITKIEFAEIIFACCDFTELRFKPFDVRKIISCLYLRRNIITSKHPAVNEFAEHALKEVKEILIKI